VTFGENNLMSKARTQKLQDGLFLYLTLAAIIASAFHFWPLEDSKFWQMLNVSNLCCLAGLVSLFIYLISSKNHFQALSSILHVSIPAYLVINFLSIAFVDNLSRPASYTIKMLLIFLGGFFLFQRAMLSEKAIKTAYQFIVVAALISIFSCIYTRFTGAERFGFHANAFKYGTYLAILLPLCSVYLLSGSKYQVLLAIFIVPAAVVSAGTMGAVLSILAGFIAVLLFVEKRSIKAKVLLCILLLLPALFIEDKYFEKAIRQDLKLTEEDNVNLRQRYIEWQAEINLLEKRGVTGTGAGCVNDYRSNFYYRLPKLNTLKDFDQNGFLATVAETGLLGLLTFCWIIIHYGGLAFRDFLYFQCVKNSIAWRLSAANMASFVSALVANMFSSVHYNGILIIFVLLLGLISSVSKIYGEQNSEA